MNNKLKEGINYKLLNASILIIFLMLVVIFLKYTTIFVKLQSMLVAVIPFFIGFFISWLLLPLSKFLQEKLKMKEKGANALSILFSIIVLVGFFVVIIPLLVIQVITLVESFPNIWTSFLEKLPKITGFLGEYKSIFSKVDIDINQVYEYIKQSVVTVSSMLGYLFSGALSTFSFILQIILGYVVAFYFMGSIKEFVKSFLSLISRGDYKRRRKLVLDISYNLFSYIRGVIIISSVITVIMTVGAALIGISQPLLFGVISGVTNVIPYLGPIIGRVPIFIVALSLGYKQALLVIVLICVVQFIESNFLQPKIMSKSTDLHPVSIIVGLLIFGSLFGIVGMVISTPVISIINVWLKQSKFKDKVRI